MLNRGRKKTSADPMSSYYSVIYAFVFICVAAVATTMYSPKQKFSEMDVLDASQMLIHNGQGHQFKHGANGFFEHKTLADAKQMFMSALSDTNNLGSCRTSKGLGEG